MITSEYQEKYDRVKLSDSDSDWHFYAQRRILDAPDRIDFLRSQFGQFAGFFNQLIDNALMKPNPRNKQGDK